MSWNILQDGNLQITPEGVECRFCAGCGMPEGTPIEVQSQGFYPSAAICLPDMRRSPSVKGLPKLSLAVQASSHLLPSCRATTGAGAGYKHFVPLPTQAVARVSLDLALADARYDSESNHRLARMDMGVHTPIPATSGRPGSGPPTGRYRRMMRDCFAKRKRKKSYDQRWQVETVNSMIKCNLGSTCRAHTPRGRRKDMSLRVLTHNIMLVVNL